MYIHFLHCIIYYLKTTWHAGNFFVDASIILSQNFLTTEDICAADEKLIQFCEAFEKLYGIEACTPNMQLLHYHLIDSLFDFGPPASFWPRGHFHLKGIMESCNHMYTTGWDLNIK